MNRTSIEWCRTYAADGTFEEGFSTNPVRFRPHGSTALRTMCQKVSPGCAHCYAEGITRRSWPKDAAVKFPGYTAAGLLAGEFVLDEAMLLHVLRTKKPARIFWGDMTDLFGEWVPDAFLDRMFAVCALTPHLTHIFLTKRAERMRRYMEKEESRTRILQRISRFIHDGFAFKRRGWREADRLGHAAMLRATSGPLPNVWLGVSVENQQQWDERSEHLLNTPAAVRFISAEPLLGPVNFGVVLQCYRWIMRDVPVPFKPLPDDQGKAIDWVIVGGESGAGARPMHPDWARSLRDQCAAAGVPFFFKQWGEWTPWQPDGGICEWKSQAGKLMDRHAFPDFKDSSVKNWTDDRFFDGDDPAVHQRVGKKVAGDLLDGVRHHAFPEVRA